METSRKLTFGFQNVSWIQRALESTTFPISFKPHLDSKKSKRSWEWGQPRRMTLLFNLSKFWWEKKVYLSKNEKEPWNKVGMFVYLGLLDVTIPRNEVAYVTFQLSETVRILHKAFIPAHVRWILNTFFVSWIFW